MPPVKDVRADTLFFIDSKDYHGAGFTAANLFGHGHGREDMPAGSSNRQNDFQHQ